ncbi:MAG TPA: TetR/AcrR family transcriptional regulator [Pseudonocardia sp.]|jgi:AcrR family transcriptional regulator
MAIRNTDALRARRREAILAKLLAAVEQLCGPSRETYAELSVERLISTAGVNRSTFYAYFDDKTALLHELAEQVLDQLLEVASHWYQLPAHATKDDLHQALGRVIEAYLSHQVVMAAIADAAARSAAVSKPFETLMDRSTAALAAYIRRGQREHFVDRALDPEPTAAWLMWMSEGALAQLIGPASPAERTRLHAGLTDIFWHGLRMGAAR